MYLDKFRNYLEAEKKHSILTVNAYTKDLEEFIDFLESTGASFNKNIEKIVVKIGAAKVILTTVANGRFLREIKIETKAIKPTTHLFKCKIGLFVL